MAYQVLESHVSPDGALTFLVVRADDGDITVGFAGCAWHTHGDLLIWDRDGDPLDLARELTEDVLNDRILIVTLRSGTTTDTWVTSDPAGELRDKEDGESMEFRFWSGKRKFLDDEVLASGVRCRSSFYLPDP